MFGPRKVRFAVKYVAAILLIWSASDRCTLAQIPLRADDWKNGIPFQVNRTFGAILIRAQVNQRYATLIVDTGSSHTILSPAVMQVYPQSLEQAPVSANGSGLVGTAGWAEATVEIGAVTWIDRRVLVMNDFQDISNSMKQKIDGILGADLLREFSVVVIDYKHRRLVLLR